MPFMVKPKNFAKPLVCVCACVHVRKGRLEGGRVWAYCQYMFLSSCIDFETAF